MARVTVEDCVEKIPNRFELVMLASRRARQLSSGAPLLVERDHDKNPVVALRELARGGLDHTALEQDLIRNYQRVITTDDDDAELAGLLAEERAVPGAVTEEAIDPAELEAEMAEVGDDDLPTFAAVADEDDGATAEGDALDMTEEGVEGEETGFADEEEDDFVDESDDY